MEKDTIHSLEEAKMRIIIDKDLSDGGTERMVVEISDKMLLKLGKKYFELAAEADNEEVDSNDRTT